MDGVSLTPGATHSPPTLHPVASRLVRKLTPTARCSVASQTAEELVVATVGKVDAKRRIEDAMLRLMSANIVQCLGTMLDTVVF